MFTFEKKNTFLSMFLLIAYSWACVLSELKLDIEGVISKLTRIQYDASCDMNVFEFHLKCFNVLAILIWMQNWKKPFQLHDLTLPAHLWKEHNLLEVFIFDNTSFTRFIFNMLC